MSCTHATRNACARCQAQYCPTCSPGETCRDCAYQVLENAAKVQARPEPVASAPPPRSGVGLASVGALGVLVAAGVLAAGPPVLGPPLVHRAAGGPAQPDAQLSECVDHVWTLRGALGDHLAAHARLPGSLLELPGEAAQLRCPGGGAYVYAVSPDRPAVFYLACPAPGAHRVQAIEAGPERLVPVVTQ